MSDRDPEPCPGHDLLPHLVYCEHDRPAFGSDPHRRYDRHPSNPDWNAAHPRWADRPPDEAEP